MFEIVTKEMLTPAICRMKVRAPRLAAAAQPGQFLIVRADEKGERIPLTISDYDRTEGTVTIVTQRIGASSSDIISFEPGESFADVVGPLGCASEFVEMTPEQLAHLFEPYRTTKSGGSGLGLMVTSRIVHDHGGTIAAESSPGEGTVFTVRLPRIERRIRELK